MHECEKCGIRTSDICHIFKKHYEILVCEICYNEYEEGYADYLIDFGVLGIER